VLIARITLEAADVFDAELYDLCESEIKLCLGMLDTVHDETPSAYAFLEQHLDDAWNAALAAGSIGLTGPDVVCPSLKELGLAKPD
jgi:hypothetical protein